MDINLITNWITTQVDILKERINSLSDQQKLIGKIALGAISAFVLFSILRKAYNRFFKATPKKADAPVQQVAANMFNTPQKPSENKPAQPPEKIPTNSVPNPTPTTNPATTPTQPTVNPLPPVIQIDLFNTNNKLTNENEKEGDNAQEKSQHKNEEPTKKMLTTDKLSLGEADPSLNNHPITLNTTIDSGDQAEPAVPTGGNEAPAVVTATNQVEPTLDLYDTFLAELAKEDWEITYDEDTKDFTVKNAFFGDKEIIYKNCQFGRESKGDKESFGLFSHPDCSMNSLVFGTKKDGEFSSIGIIEDSQLTKGTFKFFDTTMKGTFVKGSLHGDGIVENGKCKMSGEFVNDAFKEGTYYDKIKGIEYTGVFEKSAIKIGYSQSDKGTLKAGNFDGGKLVGLGIKEIYDEDGKFVSAELGDFIDDSLLAGISISKKIISYRIAQNDVLSKLMIIDSKPESISIKKLPAKSQKDVETVGLTKKGNGIGFKKFNKKFKDKTFQIGRFADGRLIEGVMSFYLEKIYVFYHGTFDYENDLFKGIRLGAQEIVADDVVIPQPKNSDLSGPSGVRHGIASYKNQVQFGQFFDFKNQLALQQGAELTNKNIFWEGSYRYVVGMKIFEGKKFELEKIENPTDAIDLSEVSEKIGETKGNKFFGKIVHKEGEIFYGTEENGVRKGTLRSKNFIYYGTMSNNKFTHVTCYQIKSFVEGLFNDEQVEKIDKFSDMTNEATTKI